MQKSSLPKKILSWTIKKMQFSVNWIAFILLSFFLCRLSGLREAQRILDRDEAKSKIIKEVKCLIYTNGDILHHVKKG